MERGRAEHPVELEPAVPSGSGSHRASDHRPEAVHDPSVTFRRLEPSYSDVVLPAAFLGVTLLGVLFVLVILIVWIRSHAVATERRRRPEDKFATGESLDCPFSRDGDRFRVLVQDNEGDDQNCSKEKENSKDGRPVDDFAFRLPRILDDPVDLKFEDEGLDRNVRRPPVAQMRKSADGRPGVPGDEVQGGNGERKDSNQKGVSSTSNGEGSKFALTVEESAGSSKMKVPNDGVNKSNKFKVSLGEPHWILHGKPPLDWRSYSLNKAFGLSCDAVRSDLSAPSSTVNRCSSATRSPSLEKDDKSPFFQRNETKSAEFCFGNDAIERCAASTDFKSGNTSPVIEVRIQPQSTDFHCALELNSHRARTPESPNINSDSYRVKNSYLRRAGSLNSDMRFNSDGVRSPGINSVINMKTSDVLDFKGEFKRQQKDKYLRKTVSGIHFGTFDGNLVHSVKEVSIPGDSPKSLDGLDCKTDKEIEKGIRNLSDLGTVSAFDNFSQESARERSEVQNSPRMSDSPGKENDPGSRFNFSPKFFDSKSPKFFNSTNDQKSPSFFAENQSRNASPKSFKAEGPQSPRISSFDTYKAVRSPLIMENSGNRFRFERADDRINDNKMIETLDEVDCVFVIKSADDADLPAVDLCDNEKTDLEKLSPQPYLEIDNHPRLVEACNDILLNNVQLDISCGDENNTSNASFERQSTLSRSNSLMVDESYRNANTSLRSMTLSRDNSLKVSEIPEDSSRRPSVSRQSRPILSRDNSFNVAVDDPSQDEKLSGDKFTFSRDNSLNVCDATVVGVNMSRRKSALLSRENSFNVATEEGEFETEDGTLLANVDKELRLSNEIDENFSKSENNPLLTVIEDSQDSLSIPLVGNTANYRRQRLKSISLDSDNAKFIEQNLGIPIVKHLRQENLFDLQTESKSSESGSYDNDDNDSDAKFDDENLQTQIVLPTHKNTYFKFGVADMNHVYEKFDIEDILQHDMANIVQSDDVLRNSPELSSPVKFLRDNSSAISFSEMQPRFSPKEFESFDTNDVKMSKVSKNIRNLTIDINKRDEDLEKELLQYDCLDSASEKRMTPKTPTLKIKATSLDSSETLNLSLPQSNTLQVPQNSISVPNTPKKQLKQALSHKSGKLIKSNNYGGNLNDIMPRACPETQQRKLYMNVKCPANFKDSGIFLRENHANLMLFQASKYTLSRGANSLASNFSRRMGSFDENMVDLAEVGRHNINVQGCGREFLDHRLSLPHKQGDGNFLGSNLLSFKQNLSVSSTNLKTLPEGVPSNDFETQPDVDKLSKRTLLQRRGSNQSLTINLDGTGPNLKYSTLSLQGSNLSLASFGASNYNLTNLKNSASNFSLNTDNRQKKNILERRNSNTSLTLTLDCSNQHGRLYSGSNCNLQGSHYSLANTDQQTGGLNKKCLLQRRGSNTSLTLNLQGSSGSNLNRCTSNSSLNIHNNNGGNIKIGQKKGLLERRSSNTSLTLNINGGSNSQFDSNRVLSVSNYNLDGSSCGMSRYNSNQSISNVGEQSKKGLLERRSSNTSLTLNLNSSNYNLQTSNNDVPRDIEIDETVIQNSLIVDVSQQREKHRKSLSTENLFPKSYKSRTFHCKNTDNVYSFGSHDNLWSNSYVSESMENIESAGGNNLTYIGGDQENEMIYAFGARQHIESAGFPAAEPVRNITTKPLSPHSTSEDFKMYLANIQHLQNASNTLTRQQLKDLNLVFCEGYSKSECSSLLLGKKSPTEGIASQLRHLTLEKVFPSISSDENPLNEGEYNPQRLLPEPGLPCPEYQKSLLRNLHQEFWDLPTNFQEKPMVFGSHPKNRYKTILPNEHSRVILRAEAGEIDEGYINANYIKGHDYSKNCYIATQGPLQNTVYDFWLMVYQNSSQFHKDGCTKTNEDRHFGSPRAKNKNTREKSEEKCVEERLGTQKIVMLTNLVENGRQKCEKYFPLELNEELLFQHVASSSYSSACSGGNFFPDNINTSGEETKLEDYEANSFKIKNIGILNKVGYTIRKLNVVYKNKYLKCAPKSSDIFKDDLVKIDIEILNDDKENVKIVVDTPDDPDDSASTNKLEEDDTDSLIVYHYWFDNWADHKCPKDVTALLDLSLDVSQNCQLDFETENKDGAPNDNVIKKSFSDRAKSFDRPDNPSNNKTSIDKSITYFDFSSYSRDAKDNDSNKGSTLDIDTERAPKERRLSAFQLAKAFFDEAAKASNSSEENIKNISSRKNSLAGRLDLPKPRQDSVTRRESTGRIDFKKNIAALKPVSNKIIRDGAKKNDPTTLLVVRDDTKVKSVKKVFSLNKIDTAMPPIIVHCSAGIGRTGCLIAILNGIRQLKVDQRVDILGIVCNMRLNRGGMVQNSEQYELIHKVLCLYEDIGLPDVE